MRTRHLYLLAVAGLFTTMFAACSKDMTQSDQPKLDEKNAASVNYEFENVSSTTALSADATGRLAAVTGDASMAKASSGRFDITWDTAAARLKEIRFEAKRGKDQVSFKLTTDRYIDLLKVPGALGAIKVPVGTYQQVKVFAQVKGDKKDPAVILKGRLTWDGKTIPMDIQLSGVIELKAQGKDVVVSDSSVIWKGKLQVNMDLALSKLQIGDFTGSFDSGKLVINIDMNSNLHDKLAGAVESSMSVEHTHD